MAKTSEPAPSTEPTEPEEVLTEVQKQEQRNAELRVELAAKNAEREAQDSAEVEGLKIAQLKAEEAVLVREIDYAERLRAGRVSAKQDEADAAEAAGVVVEVPPVEVPPTDPPVEVVAPDAPAIEATTGKGGK